MHKIFQRRQNQKGITGLETAIVLIVFVVVSSVFAFAVLSTSLFSSDKSKETIQAGPSEVRDTPELPGSVIAKANSTGDVIDQQAFQVSNAAGGKAVDITPGETIIQYLDVSQAVTLVSGDFTVTALCNSDSDSQAEPGELYEIKICGLEVKLTGDLKEDTVFFIQVKPPKGAVV